MNPGSVEAVESICQAHLRELAIGWSWAEGGQWISIHSAFPRAPGKVLSRCQAYK